MKELKDVKGTSEEAMAKKEAWAFWANMSGPFWTKPQRVTHNPESGGVWWRRCGNAGVDGMGLRERKDHGYLTFASHDKAEVEKFICGFMAARLLVARFASDA